MKKLNYLILGLAGLAMASCSNDDLQGPAEGTYQLTVNLPKDMATRAIGQAITAPQTLSYTVFTSDGIYVTQGTQAFESGETSTTINLPLVKGNGYKIAFFSQSTSSSSVYTYDANTAQVSVDYSAMTYAAGVDADAYDCFSKLYEIEEVGGAISETVTLVRPVAQINWGTSDLTSAAVEQAFGTNAANLQTTLKATVPNTFNILNNTYGTADVVNFPTTALPAATGDQATFPVTGDYKYLAMQYVLAESSMTSDLTLIVSSNETSAEVTPVVIEVSNAPLQANYRTNIYGALLTDQASFNVTLSSTWGDPSNNIDLTWDGETSTTPTVSADGTTYTINKASDLAGLADMVNNGTEDFSDKTIELAYDFDMSGAEFPMIGSGTRSSGTVSGNAFKGTFDGNGKTISNLKVSYDGDDKNAAVGFIPNLAEGGEVKNVTFENVVIDGGKSEQAGVIGTMTAGASVSNVTVTSGSITSAESAGAIVGRLIKNGKISGCYNGTEAGTGATINGAGNVGGIAGAAYYTSPGNDGMTVENCYNYGNVNNSGQVTGGIVGLSASSIENCYNYGPITGTSGVGGIVGIAASNGGVSGCTNEGSVNGTIYVGGICGWITYYTGDNYQVTNTVKLSQNTNNATVTGTGSVGGILGMSQNGGIVTDNTNNAPALNSNSTVAGIAGNITHPGNNTQYNDGYILLTGNVNKTPLTAMTGTQKGFIYTGVAAVGSQSNEE